MCLAIYKPAGAEVTEEHLRNGFSNHSDGAGFAWAADGKLHVVKGIFDVEEVIKQYELIKEYPCLIHFRKATHGKIDKTNCHPFLFNDGKLALIHNGVLSIKCTIDGMSDTFHFIKLVLEPMVKRNNVPINDDALQYLLSTSIGSDKMVIMDGDGNAYVINENKGKWEGGVWYSNTSFSWNIEEFKSNNSSGYYEGHQSYFNRTNQGHAPNASYEIHKNNWRKRFEDSAEDDESYLEFWKRTAKADQNIGASSSLKEAQKLPLLLKERVDDSGNVHIIDVEEIKEPEKTYGPGMMCDYGWWDEEIETDIEKFMKNAGCSREQAIIRVFNA
jgi:glutamine amidotransferase